MVTHIYQDFKTKKISKVEIKESVQVDDANYLIDCDNDSILILGNFLTSGEELEIKLWSDSFINLIPVVTLDERGELLMQAFLNFDAITLSINTKIAHYFSRSRNKIWKKGEESGHTQQIESIFYNKTYNFFIYIVKQNKVACHTGFYSCFYRKVTNDKIEDIYPGTFQKINGELISE